MLPTSIYQAGFEEFVNGLWAKDWVTVFQDFPMNTTGIAICTFLIEPDRTAEYVERADWYEDISRSRPGFDRYGVGVDAEVEYHRFGSRHDGEPVVLIRHFVGGWTSKPEVVEELRLMFNLYEHPDGTGFSEIDEVGDKHLVIRVADNGVQIRKQLLRRYLAARQKAMVINVLSDVWEECEKGDALELPEDQTLRTEDMCFEYWATNIDFNSLVSSRWLGQRIIPPPPIEECEIWPFEPMREHEKFVVGVDERGRNILHTCDPNRVPSGPFAPRDAPQKLTPVIFRKEVLTKYYQDPVRYEVGAAILRDRDAWMLRMDNDHPDHVTVFLGDLGTDLPISEQKYWRAFNIPREGRGLSEAAFKASILGQFANASRADHRFKRLYAEVVTAWDEAYGFPLYKELNDDDRHVLAGLRQMLTNSGEEFDSLVVKLAKLLIDSLNDEAIKVALGGGLPGEQPVARFDRYLTSRDYSEVKRDLHTLRTIYGVRSRGAAHRRGSDFDLAKAGLDPNDLTGSFEKLLEASVEMLEGLKEFAQRPIKDEERNL